MRIQELDPGKQYAVLLQGNYFSQQDVERVSAKLKQHGINGIVLAGADIQAERYWGIYFTEDKAWLKRADGTLYFYPSPDIAGAHLTEVAVHFSKTHAVVMEFGTELERLEIN